MDLVNFLAGNNNALALASLWAPVVAVSIFFPFFFFFKRLGVKKKEVIMRIKVVIFMYYVFKIF